MSEIKNPLFDSERELLERQKEEYKNALMGDVEQIKSQGQQIGKKVAIAGGVLVAGLLIRSMFGGGKKKSKKLKKKDAPKVIHSSADGYGAGMADYDSFIHDQEDEYTLSSEHMPHASHKSRQSTGVSRTFMNSELAQFLTQQVTALVLIYLTKKVEEYLSSVSKNNDIAATPIEVTEIETIEYTVPQEDAI